MDGTSFAMAAFMRCAKMGLLAASLMSAVACSPSEPEPASSPSLTIEHDATLGTVSAVKAARGAGPQVLSAQKDATASTLDFLHERRTELGFRLPKEQLVGERTMIDDLSMTHVRMQQVERGVRVIGGEVNAHYDRAGRLSSMHQRLVPGLDAVDLTPVIDAAQAKSLARADRPGHDVSGEPELVVRGDRAPALAWEITVTSGLASAWRLHLDAKTGAIVDAKDLVDSLAGTGLGLDGQRHPVSYALDQNKANVMVDVTRKTRIFMNDALGGQGKTQLITSTDPDTWDATSATAPGSAVTAQIAIGQINDFFLKEWNRRGWDGLDGDEQIFVHVGNPDNTPMDNAFYNGASNLVAIGDGEIIFKPLAGALDVLAHELGHAVTGSTAKLAPGNQSGTLNEHISDVFGAVVEHGLKPDPVNNWLIGEGALKTGKGPLRDMGAPEKGFSKQPRHLKEFVQTTEDNGGVHVNAGIGNNAAFLATVGGTNAVSGITVKKGFGWQNLSKVWYRADTIYLTSNADYAVLAKATLAAAADLGLSKDDIDTLDCAWKAVGVVQGECQGLQAPTVKVENAPSEPASEATDAGAPAIPVVDPWSTPNQKAVEATAGKKSKAVEKDDEKAQPSSSPATTSTDEPSGAMGLGCSSGAAAPGSFSTWGVVLGVLAVMRRRRR